MIKNINITEIDKFTEITEFGVFAIVKCLISNCLSDKYLSRTGGIIKELINNDTFSTSVSDSISVSDSTSVSVSAYAFVFTFKLCVSDKYYYYIEFRNNSISLYTNDFLFCDIESKNKENISIDLLTFDSKSPEIKYHINISDNNAVFTCWEILQNRIPEFPQKKTIKFFQYFLLALYTYEDHEKYGYDISEILDNYITMGIQMYNNVNKFRIYLQKHSSNLYKILSKKFNDIGSIVLYDYDDYWNLNFHVKTEYGLLYCGHYDTMDTTYIKTFLNSLKFYKEHKISFNHYKDKLEININNHRFEFIDIPETIYSIDSLIKNHLNKFSMCPLVCINYEYCAVHTIYTIHETIRKIDKYKKEDFEKFIVIKFYDGNYLCLNDNELINSIPLFKSSINFKSKTQIQIHTIHTDANINKETHSHLHLHLHISDISDFSINEFNCLLFEMENHGITSDFYKMTSWCKFSSKFLEFLGFQKS